MDSQDITFRTYSFNTQPPEGGWRAALKKADNTLVSTHSRPKAAVRFRLQFLQMGSFNTQPPEGGCLHTSCFNLYILFQHTAARRRLIPANRTISKPQDVSTHSRPKAAGAQLFKVGTLHTVSTHSRPKAAGRRVFAVSVLSRFQHTAARRRLTVCTMQSHGSNGFNTQPPEGGCPALPCIG